MPKHLLCLISVAIAILRLHATEAPSAGPLVLELDRLVAECMEKGVIPIDAAEVVRHECEVYVRENPCVFTLTEAESKALATDKLEEAALQAEFKQHLAKLTEEPLPGLVGYLAKKHTETPLTGRQLLLATKMLRCKLLPGKDGAP